MTIQILRSDMLVFCLDDAITQAFGKACNVVKDHLIGLPYGTVEVDGKAFDWVMKVDRVVFNEA